MLGIDCLEILINPQAAAGSKLGRHAGDDVKRRFFDAVPNKEFRLMNENSSYSIIQP